ncbi:hypothetical protein PLA107_035035 (plasmid) [Pseudomonas amygdali pv. lachrymans str. M301315]|uniref:Uncharacterized protein n=3 Tax=Pseudomonas amygdali TaxID=47877 RepID=A0AAD0PX70_PSEAV|nr:hypothetical protein PLA107_035035 [Pseudomonas amygdali pv. lachrymans str. M301315]RMT08674.1 hypothetical protein ALP54_02313 [Pseudomonas amygdali pv. lachrymans]
MGIGIKSNDRLMDKLMMTDDMRRMINILVDWMLIQKQAPDCIFSLEVVNLVLGAPDDHALRMRFALSLALGIEPDNVRDVLKTDSGAASIEELLARCSRVFLKT